MEYFRRLDPSLHGLSPAEMEAKMKEQAAMQAMMDDLGSARLDQLPLDDEPKGSKHVRLYHNNRSKTQYRQPSAPTTSLGDVWRDAIAAGAFDDEDAEGVKNLDDLGGGRIYDNVNAYKSREHRVVDVTMRILDQRTSRSARQDMFPAESWQPPHIMNGAATASPSRASSGWEQVSSARAGRKHSAINPITRPARLRPPPVVSSLPVSLPKTVATPDAPPPLEVPNIIFKTEANFLSRDVHPAMRAVVILSAAKGPELGFFIVSLFNRKYCEWAMSAWNDYYSGNGNLLAVAFQEGSTSHGYQIFFDTNSDLIGFLETVRSILAEKHVALVDSDPASVSAPQLTAVSGGGGEAASTVTRADQAVGDVRRQNTPTGTQVARSTALATNDSATSSKPRVETKPSVTHEGVFDAKPALTWATPPPSSEIPDSHRSGTSLPMENRRVGEDAGGSDAVADGHRNTVSTPQISKQHDTPEAPKMKHAAVGTNTNEHEAEATSLLSTLQSYRHSNSAEIDESSMRMFRNIVSATARLFFQFFCFSEVAGKTRTVEELDQTARGVKMGFLEHTVKSAKAQGFNEKQVRAIKDEITRVFESELAAKLSEQRNAAKSRQTYALDELLSMRDRAVEPPGDLVNIPYKPEPNSGSLQTSSLPRDVPTFPRQVVASLGADKGANERETKFHKSQVAKVRDAMDWALGKTATSKLGLQESKTASKGGQVTVGAVDKTSSSRDKGLQGSRWASSSSVIQASNFFTGPRYEKAWSKHSYLEELCQLEPQDKVTAATEDLADLYFPPPENIDAKRESVNTRVPGVNESQASAATSSSYGAPTPKQVDRVEAVTEGISRLSIRSPTAPQSKSDRPVPSTEQRSIATRALREVCSQPASTAAQQAPQETQPKVRGLAASRHSTGAGPSSSGNFNFYMPQSARQ